MYSETVVDLIHALKILSLTFFQEFKNVPA